VLFRRSVHRLRERPQRPAAGGHFACSLEASPANASAADGYVLLPHGRYQHERSYVERVLANAHLEIVLIGTETLRYERQDPVTGLSWSQSDPLTRAPNDRHKHRRIRTHRHSRRGHCHCRNTPAATEYLQRARACLNTLISRLPSRFCDRRSQKSQPRL